MLRPNRLSASNRSRCRQTLLVLAPAGAMLASVPAANADTRTWRGAGNDGLWGNADNWAEGAVPGAGDFVLFPDTFGAAYEIDLGGQERAVQGVYFENYSGAYTLNNGTLSAAEQVAGGPFDDLSATPNANVVNVRVTTSSPTLAVGGYQGGMIVNGVVGDGLGGGDFGIVLAARLGGANTYTGETFVNGNAAIQGGGSSLNTSAVRIFTGNLFLRPGGPASNALPNAAPVSLRNGALELIAPLLDTPAGAVREVIGPLTLDHSGGRVRVASSASTAAVLDAASLTRGYNNRATGTIDLSTGPAGGQRIVLRSAPTAQLIGGGGAPGSSSVSMLPFLFSSDGGLVTYDHTDETAGGLTGTRGLRPLAPNEYATAIASGSTSTNNVRLGAPTLVSADTTVNALRLDSGGGIVTDQRLTIASGAVSITVPNTTESTPLGGGPGAVLDFGAAEGVVYVANNASVQAPRRARADLTIEGTGGLTKTGPGALVLARANNYTGATVVNDGWLVSQAQGSLGSGPVSVNDRSGLIFEHASQELNQAVAFSTGPSARGQINTYTVSVLDVDPGLTVKMNGAVSVEGELFKRRGGRLWLTGPVDTHFGAGSMQVHGGELRLDGAVGGPSNRGNVAVYAGSRLTGTGRVAGSMFIADYGSVLAPGGDGGAGAGRFEAGFTQFASTGQFEVDLNGLTAGSEYDQLRSLHSTLLGGAQLVVSLGFAAEVGNQFTIVDQVQNGSLFGTFGGLPEGSALQVGDATMLITYKGGTGNDVVLTVTAVPEPAGAALLGLACGALVRRRRTRASP